MRLFFALWPDAAAGARLAELARETAARSEGKPVPVDKIHLTLAFLGEVPDSRLGDAIAAGGAAPARAFELAFDTLGWFRGARVAWVGSSESMAELTSLQSRLAAELEERAFPRDDRPYTAHITLARKVRRPVARARIEPIRWRALELALVLSETGTGRYTTIESWNLEG